MRRADELEMTGEGCIVGNSPRWGSQRFLFQLLRRAIIPITPAKLAVTSHRSLFKIASKAKHSKSKTRKKKKTNEKVSS